MKDALIELKACCNEALDGSWEPNDEGFRAMIKTIDTALNKNKKSALDYKVVLVPLLKKITGGGIHGNPYTCKEVKAALMCIAEDDGDDSSIGYLDALDKYKGGK